MIIRWKRIYREDLINNPDFMFLFGDNLQRVGMGGQAKEMRNEPNAIGVATKKSPSMSDDAFFTDDEFEDNVKELLNDLWPAIGHISNGGILVIPADGLGTGLSELPSRAPQTAKALDQMIDYLYNLDERLNNEVDDTDYTPSTHSL